MTKDSLCFVYITASSKGEANSIGELLVQQKLAACVNIFDEMTSIYRWQGKIEKSSEFVIIAKTHQLLVGDLCEKVKQIHSYECPCIVTIPIEGGNHEFLDWISEQVIERK